MACYLGKKFQPVAAGTSQDSVSSPDLAKKNPKNKKKPGEIGARISREQKGLTDASHKPLRTIQ
jgi:hypothetical protein